MMLCSYGSGKRLSDSGLGDDELPLRSEDLWTLDGSVPQALPQFDWLIHFCGRPPGTGSLPDVPPDIKALPPRGSIVVTFVKSRTAAAPMEQPLSRLLGLEHRELHFIDPTGRMTLVGARHTTACSGIRSARCSFRRVSISCRYRNGWGQHLCIDFGRMRFTHPFTLLKDGGRLPHLLDLAVTYRFE
jgi:hypothetical protein